MLVLNNKAKTKFCLIDYGKYEHNYNNNKYILNTRANTLGNGRVA